MALGDQIGKQAADDLAAGLNKAAESATAAVSAATSVIGADAADAVSDVVAAVDRLRVALTESVNELLAESAQWRALLERWAPGGGK